MTGGTAHTDNLLILLWPCS